MMAKCHEDGICRCETADQHIQKINAISKVMAEHQRVQGQKATEIGESIRDGGPHRLVFEVDQSYEKIDGPSHYGGKDNPYEAIKIIEAHELGFHLGNCVKYVLRAGKKLETTELEDLEKARWYINRRINQITGG